MYAVQAGSRTFGINRLLEKRRNHPMIYQKHTSTACLSNKTRNPLVPSRVDERCSRFAEVCIPFLAVGWLAGWLHVYVNLCTMATHELHVLLLYPLPPYTTSVLSRYRTTEVKVLFFLIVQLRISTSVFHHRSDLGCLSVSSLLSLLSIRHANETDHRLGHRNVSTNHISKYSTPISMVGVHNH
jgi:hypothetical protein